MNENNDISEKNNNNKKMNPNGSKNNPQTNNPIITGGGDPNLSPDAGKRLI
jgi:hypothetical protein